MTQDLERTRSFYRDALGLPIAADSPFMTRFAHDAGLVLVAVPSRQQSEVELCFESPEIEQTMEALRRRGVEFADELRHLEFGSVVHFRDPEGHLLSLLRPVAAAAPEIRPEPAAPPGSHVGDGLAGSGGRPALAMVERTADATLRLSTAVVACRDHVLLRGFYRDRLGLQVAEDTPGWVRFHAGAVSIVLRPRHLRLVEPDGGRSVALVFETAELGEWAEEARARGVEFESTPIDRGFGLEAETVDPDGNTVIVREPATQESLEERLAEDFEDDGVPRHAAMRSPVKKGAHAVSRVAIKPEYRSGGTKPAAAKPAGPSRKAKRAVSTRGAGPAGTRLKPKRTADPKRARTRPATGRLKKAEARSAAAKKRSVARKSRTRPVKRKAAKVARPRSRRGR
jgi:catechol 2,3-dioxygenase-like lactoylglutathione lyase family enzyme